jgi:hypothetical protein
MIADLIVKELRHHLMSLRFLVGFALALTLVATSAFVLSSSYRHDLGDFSERVNQQDAFFRQYAHANRLGPVSGVFRPPSQAVVVRGLPEDVGVETLDGNPMRELFPPMDLALIVAVVMSLLGIVLGFDAVNGEREEGTLRLVLANRVRRADIIVAKWTAGMIVLSLAFLGAFLCGLLVVVLRAGVAWGADEWMSLVGIAVVSLLYSGVFFSLALALSVLFARSSTSVLASLLAWVVFVLVIPNVSPYVAAQFVRLPAVAALERERQYLTSEKRDDIGRARMVAVYQKYAFTAAELEPSAARARSAIDPEFARRYGAFRAESAAVWKKVNAEQGAAAERLMKDWEAQSKAQFDLSKTIAHASPLSSLLFAVTDLSATGFHALERFRQQAEAHGGAFSQFVQARYREEQQRNPAYDVNDFIDLAGRPRFTWIAPRWQDRFSLALPQAGALFAWMAVFFVASAAFFLRFDPR